MGSPRRKRCVVPFGLGPPVSETRALGGIRVRKRAVGMRWVLSLPNSDGALEGDGPIQLLNLGGLGYYGHRSE